MQRRRGGDRPAARRPRLPAGPPTTASRTPRCASSCCPRIHPAGPSFAHRPGPKSSGDLSMCPRPGRSRYDSGSSSPLGAPFPARGAAAQEGTLLGGSSALSRREPEAFTEPNGACYDLRRPGRHRHRERAVVQRTAGGNHDVTEALEQQTATSEMLRAIAARRRTCSRFWTRSPRSARLVRRDQCAESCAWRGTHRPVATPGPVPIAADIRDLRSARPARIVARAIIDRADRSYP